ncbi:MULTISPECIES: hypothetical protein [unclassified Streptomyces]|uniref:hypothetical protein n=1 Tax=unclassified Streptomyces TaxID=2593676 RepID=UPI000DD620FA|nr:MULTISPECIES: hypothetical protein [unclassified Streptomyces]QZZ25211.1 hypothetical protein A7X85_01895 [Streptomyces sp. ST1015]
MSRALPKYRKRRITMIGSAAAVALSGAVIAGTALAGQTPGSSDESSSTKLAAANTVNCPDVAAQFQAVPAGAKAQVDRDLALLVTQVQEANNRLASSVGQGGANFAQNAILNPLKDKRVATINRIAQATGTAIGRQQVDTLATCSLNNAGGNNAGGNNAGGNNAGGNNAGNAGGNNAGNNCNNGGVAQQGNGGNNNAGGAARNNGGMQQGNNAGNGHGNNGGGAQQSNGGNNNAGGAAQNNGGMQQGNAGAQGNNCGNNGGAAGNGNNRGGAANNGGGNANAANTVNCPDVAARLRAVPAGAKAEVDRNLALLVTQVQEANNRLASSAGQGGANFVRNAILDPLKDKRVATINRIVNAVGGTAGQRQVNSLATCTLNR